MENDTDAAPKADEVEPVEFEPDDAQKRLWLKTLTALLQLRSHESDPSGACSSPSINSMSPPANARCGSCTAICRSEYVR